MSSYGTSKDLHRLCNSLIDQVEGVKSLVLFTSLDESSVHLVNIISSLTSSRELEVWKVKYGPVSFIYYREQ